MLRSRPILTRTLAPLLPLAALALFHRPLVAGTPLDVSDLPVSPLLAQSAPSGGPIIVNEPELIAPTPSTPPAVKSSGERSISVTVNLIRQLVELGVLPKEKAEGLLKQAQEEAEQARAELLAQQQVVVQTAVTQALANVQSQGGMAASVEPLPPADESSRVTYVPEVVRRQIRDEIKRDLESTGYSKDAQIQAALPEWVRRFRLFADIRIRGEGIYYPEGNDNSGSFPNFNAINTGRPFDTSGTEFSPQLNTDADRQRIRLRLRVGLESDLGSGFTAGLRLATGNTNTPTSTNQDLGLANGGQGGNFSKYAIWLDRAFLKWETGPTTDRLFTATIGRFDNPFFSTETIFDEDLGFDGAVISAKYRINDKFTPFFAGGAFPVFNTELNFASNRPSKFSSSDKWLYGAQLGTIYNATPKVQFKLAAAFYDFDRIEGRLSDPFVPLSENDAGNTDDTRPAFAQKGNTYRPLRNIIPTAENGFGTTNQYQYYGLATPFRDLVLTGKVDINYWEPFQISLFGEYIKNVAFDRGAIDKIAVNNRGTTNDLNTIGKFQGGDTAWMVGARFGKPVFEKFGDWSAGVNYRYIESDAVVDGFNDSDFGLGGTNLKGFSLWASMALSPRVNVALRWTSADEIAGPAYSVDIVQIDFNATF